MKNKIELKTRISRFISSSLVLSSFLAGASYSLDATAVQVAYFPPVPESWNVTVEGDTWASLRGRGYCSLLFTC